MSNSLIAFLVIVAVLVVGFLILMRNVIVAIQTSAADHARTYALAYAKGIALVSSTLILSFIETFRNLDRGSVTDWAWWNWAVAFSVPIGAAIMTFVAFIDKTVSRSSDKREEELNHEPAKNNP